MNLSSKQKHILFYIVCAFLFLFAIVYTIQRIASKKVIAKQKEQISLQKQVIDKASLTIDFYKFKAQEDSLIIIAYERRINILYQELNPLRQKLENYEILLKKRPTDPVRIIPISDAEKFLSDRYFPTESKSKGNSK